MQPGTVVASPCLVVVLEWQASGNPTGDGTENWVWDAERLQTALDRAVK